MKTTLLSILVFTLISCDKSTKEWIGTSWIVSELTQEGKNTVVANEVILTIKSETEFTLKLDTNNCFGTYTITGKNTIKLENLGCTEMCCDSDFSIAVSNALYKVSNINFTKESVTLAGNDVKIKFKKYTSSQNSKEAMTAETGKFTQGEKIPTEETTNVGMFEQSTGEKDTTIVSPEGNFITLYKSPCKGTCEEFTMELYQNGVVVYNGKYNAKVQGRKVVKLDANELEALFLAFEESNFTNFADTYDDETIMDIQNTYLTYKGKKIQIRYQPNAPYELQTLLLKVEEKAKKVLEELKKK